MTSADGQCHDSIDMAGRRGRARRRGQAKSATCGGLITDVIGTLVLVLSAPLFLFGGFIMVFFYHVDTLDIASPWFSLLPKFFFGGGFNNLFCAAAVISFRLLPISLVKRALFLLLILFLFTSCLVSGISTYGCFELQSIILQQTFLSLRTAEIIERYVAEPGFSSAWDDLQRQFFCCGTNLFNTGFEDWKHIYGRENNSVPDSCCQRESEACGAGALAAAAPSLVVHTHGCLAVLQAKLETELMTLLTGAQVLSLLVLLVSLICLVVGLCTGVPSLPGKRRDRKPSFVDLYTTRLSSEV